MSNFSTQVIESDKFGVLPTRLDDIKKLWKILKVSLLESLTTYNHFGKSLFKASRNLHFTFNHADPSFFCKLTLSLLTRQAQTSHLLSQSVNEAFTEITKDMEAYEEKLEQVRLQTFDTISEGLKFLTLARVNYVKEKEKYEKACKEAESWVTEKKKPITDPLLYYNLTHLRRLKRKVMEALHTLNAAEQQAKDALEVFSVRQKGLNLGLSESMHLFKGTLQTIYERMVKAVKRHNKVLAQFLAKELEDVEKSNVLVSIDNFTFAPESEEQQFINSKKLAHGDSDLSKESKESKDAKLRYPEIHSKLLQKPQETSDTDCLDYVDLAQKHFEASSLIFEDRQKVVKGLKGYMQELSTLCATIEKTFQKLSKNSPSQQSASVLCRKIGISVDPFFDSLEAFGAMFNQLASFINTKSFVLDNILNDQRENFKAFQLSYGKSLKDPINLKAVVMALNAQVERLYKKIAETSEKDPGDERIPAWKVELDAVRKQREEQLQELRKQVAEAAKGITRAFEDHRAREQTKYIDFSAVIKGILTQENIFSRNLSETLSVMEGNLEGKDINVSQALAQDDLNGFLQYYELNMQENLNGQRAKDTSIVFQKLYTPPADALTEDDDKMIVEAEDTEEQAVKEDEDSEYLKKRFGLKSTERLLDSFACGIEQTIIRQGRMYVYPSAVCFTTVKLLGDFALKIPVGDMVRVEKKTMTLVFDTALSIFTKNGEIKFLAFMTRDRAFSLITSLPSREYSQTSSPERADKKGGSLESSPKQESAPIDSERKRQIQDIIRERIQRTEPEEEGESKEELRRKSLVLSDDGEAQPEPKKKSNEEKKELPAGEGKEKKAHSLEEKAPELAVTTPASNETLRKEGRTPEESVEEAALKKAHSSGEAVKKVSNEGEDVKKKLVAEEVKSSDNSAPIVARRKASSTGGRRKGTEEINPEEENEKKRLKEIIEARKPKIRAPIKPDDIYPQLVVQEVFSCSAIDMWNAVFSDKKITHKGRSYDCFWMVAKVDAGDTEIKHTKWTPNVSYEGLIEDKTTLECLKKVAEGAQVSTRGFMYTHPVKDGGPFVPKTCQVEEKQIGYWLGPDEFIMQMDVFTSKIPLSDTFVVKNSFKVRDLPGKKCEFSWRLGVEFVKSTMFKGKIQKTSQEENGLYANNIFMPVLRENIAVYMKEKATLIKRKEAHKEAEKEAAKKLKEEAAAVENKVENLNQEPANEEKNSVEEKKEKIAEAKENDETDLSGREEESEKQDKVGLREAIEGEIAKLLKASEQSKEEMKSEIKGLKMLILALLAINCVMFFMFLKK